MIAYLKLEGGAQFDRGVASAREGMAGAAGSAEELGAALRSTEARLVGAGRQSGLASGQATRLRAAQLSALAAQERFNTALNSGSASTARLASAEATLLRANERLRATTPAAPIMAASTATAVATSRMAAFRGSVTSGIATLGKLGLALGAFELARKALDFASAGKDLTTALNGVQAASHATDEEMKAVRAQAIALGKDLTVPKATAVDAAQGMEDLVKSGVKLDRAMVAVRPALLLASAAQVDTADSARILGDVLDDFHLQADQAGKVANYLAAGANSAGGGLMDMFDAMKYVGPRARAVGIGVRDVTTAITFLAKSGLQGTIAGTGIAMMLQKIAQESPASKKALADLGISAWDAQGKFKGLPNLIGQLHEAQVKFGPDSKRFLADISTAFGARAANVVASFAAGGIEHWNKFAATIKSGDVQTYANLQNRGVAAAGAQIRKELTAVGVDVFQKLEPALASAGMWLGTRLPHDLGVLGATLAPTAHLVGTVLVGAWHGVLAVLAPVAAALSAVGGFLKENKALTNGLATAVITMWAAFKGYTIARVALGMIPILFNRIGAAAEGAASGIMAMGPAGAIIAGIALVIGAATVAWNRSEEAAAAWHAAVKADADDISSTLNKVTGAITGTTTALVQQKLEAAGVYDAATKLGLSYKTITDAALGNAKATALVNAAIKGQPGLVNGQISATAKAVGKLRELAAGTALAQHNTKQLAQVQKEAASASVDHATKTEADTRVLQFNIDAHGRLVTSLAKAGSQLDNTTTSIQKQTLASQLLKNALDALNGVATSVEQTQDQLTISLGGLADKSALFKDANGNVSTSLSKSTVAGATNRNMLVGLIQNAKDAAQATADQARKHHTLSDSLKIGNDKLKIYEDRLRTAAKQAGLSTTETDKLIKKVGKLAKIKVTPKVVLEGTKDASNELDALGTDWKLKAANMSAVPFKIAPPDTSAAMATVNSFSSWFFQQVNAMSTAKVSVPSTTPGAATPGIITGGSSHASGGTAGDGPSGTVHGPGSETSDSIGIRVSRGEEIIRASQARKHRRLLKMINSGASGFASGGTAGAALSAAQSAVSAIQVSILPPNPSALKQFESAIDHASKALSAAAAAGVAPGKLAKLRDQLDKTVAHANKQLRNLRVQVNGHDMNVLESSLKGTAADVRSAFTAAMTDSINAGLSAARAARITGIERSVESHVSARNRLQAQLGSRGSSPTAYDRLASARDARAQERSTVSGAVGGFFNIASAGAGPNGDQKVSFGSMRAQQLQAKSTILKWAAGIKKLGKTFGKSKAGQHYLASLAEDGPGTWPQVEALLGAGPRALAGVIATEAAIEKAAGSVAGYVSGVTGNAAVNAAQARVDVLERQIKTQNDTIHQLDGRIEAGIRKGLNGLKIVIDPQGVAKLVAVGNKRNKRRGG